MFERRPPRLAEPPRLSKPRLPLWRQVARALVWSVLGVVVVARLMWAFVPTGPGPMGQGRPGGMVWQFDGGPGGGGRQYRPGRRTRDPVSEVPSDLWRLRIRVSDRDMNALRSTSFEWRRPTGQKRPEVRATVEEGGVTYTNVSLHLKGSAGSFRPVDSTPGLTLNVSKHAKGQSFHGFSKFSLNNSVQDPSLVAETLARELFLKAGVPAPQTDHATVILNDRDLGLYVFSEGWGKGFLRKHFQDPDGPLWDGGFVHDINEELDLNSGPETADRSALDRLVAASETRGAASRWARLSEALDTDRFASFLAMEVLLCHWDGYGMNRNNYRVFLDQATGRVVFLPHGMDQLFGRGGRMPPDSPIEPTMRGMVARAFLGTVEGNKMYHERLRRFRAEFFNEQALVARAQEIAERIRPTLEAYGPEIAREQQAGLRELCRGITRRVRSIDEQLALPREPMEFDAEGVLRLTGWGGRPGTQARPGQPGFVRTTENGLELLRIKARNGGSTGSWRTRVRVGPGRYRFEGRVRLEGIAGQGGVALRISGTRRSLERPSEGAWQPLTFQFEVEEPVADVELVCEFDGAGGEAAFDAGSLRLVRE